MTFDKHKSKSQVQGKSQIEKGKRNLDFGLSLKSLGMMEVSNNKTQRVKVTQTDPFYLLSTKKKQVDSKRENMDESNMFKENIIKEMFLESLW